MELTDVNFFREPARRRLAGVDVERTAHAVTSFGVANSADDKRPTAFGLYLLRAMAAADIGSQRALAARAQISNSTVSRMLYGEGEPDRPTLEKLAGALGLEYPDLLAQAGHGATGAATPVSLHPLAVELDRLLSDSSPLPEADRHYIADMMGRLINPYRRQLRRRRQA